MTKENALLVCKIGTAMAIVTSIAVGAYVLYMTTWLGALSAVDAIFTTKDETQFVWGALRFWFGSFFSVLSGLTTAFVLLVPVSRVEYYYTRRNND